MLLFLTLLVAYRLLVHAPLTRLLKQRRELTEGAVEKARDAIAAAEAKAEAYEEKLRNARRGIQEAREKQLQQWNGEREASLNLARDAAQQRVQQARAEIQASNEESRRTVESASQQLAAQIVAHLLSPSAAQVERVR